MAGCPPAGHHARRRLALLAVCAACGAAVPTRAPDLRGTVAQLEQRRDRLVVRLAAAEELFSGGGRRASWYEVTFEHGQVPHRLRVGCDVRVWLDWKYGTVDTSPATAVGEAVTVEACPDARPARARVPSP